MADNSPSSPPWPDQSKRGSMHGAAGAHASNEGPASGERSHTTAAARSRSSGPPAWPHHPHTLVQRPTPPKLQGKTMADSRRQTANQPNGHPSMRLSARTQYRPLPDLSSAPRARTELPRSVMISSMSSPLQYASIMDEGDGASTKDNASDDGSGDVEQRGSADGFHSPPLDPTSVATVVISQSSSLESDEDGKLYISNKARAPVSSSSSSTAAGIEGKGGGRLGSGDNTPMSTPGITPAQSPRISPVASGSVTPLMLEQSGHHQRSDREQPGGSPPLVATSNFDANYLATLGRDGDSISIRVDNRKRAKNLLQRLEGRSEAGGLLGNLIRLHNTVTGRTDAGGGGGTANSARNRKNRGEPGMAGGVKDKRQRTPMWRVRGGVADKDKETQGATEEVGESEVRRRPVSFNAADRQNSWTALSTAIRGLKPSLSSSSSADCQQSLPLVDLNAGVGSVRAPAQAAAVGGSEQQQRPSSLFELGVAQSPMLSTLTLPGSPSSSRVHTGATKPSPMLPRSISSAKISALMMTPEALAKNGIIPPPSTQSSLRMDSRFSAGYFELERNSSSPASTPPTIKLAASNGGHSTPPTHDLDADNADSERAELINKIALILEKQDFLMHLARAWHAFGSPVHRMEANLLEVAKYLKIDACFFTVPGLTLVSFGDPDTHSSETHIVRASDGYDMHRLEQANNISRRLRKGKATVHESIRDIERLLAEPPLYPWYFSVPVFFVQSFFVSMTLFHGTWREAALSGAMGLIVGALEILSTDYLTLGYLLNVLSALIVALVTALLSDHVCFAAVPMSAIINLLPGLSLALAMLELSSSNVICGAVRLVSAMMTSFMLGWGTIVGHSLGMAALGRDQNNPGFASYAECQGMPLWWWFLFVPLSTIGFSVWFKVHWRQWPAMIGAAAIGLVIQTFCDRVKVMTPISAGIASFAVGVFSNIWGRVTHRATNADIMFVGIIQLVPGSTGVRSFIYLLSEESSASSLTMSMLSTSISIAVGLLLSNGALYSEIKRFTHGSF